MAKHGISTAKAFNACTSVVKDIIIPQKTFSYPFHRICEGYFCKQKILSRNYATHVIFNTPN